MQIEEYEGDFAHSRGRPKSETRINLERAIFQVVQTGKPVVIKGLGTDARKNGTAQAIRNYAKGYKITISMGWSANRDPVIRSAILPPGASIPEEYRNQPEEAPTAPAKPTPPPAKATAKATGRSR